MRIYIGYDPRDHLAATVCVESLLKHATIPVQPILLKDHELRQSGDYWRGYRVDGDGQMWDDRDGRPFSTQFSFTRFCVPHVEDMGDEMVMFMDADMMWRADIKELIEQINPDKSLLCVQHNQQVKEEKKMDGVIQSPNTHGRKNWSSLMILRPSACQDLTRYAVNNMSGEWLHSLVWMRDEEIGALPEEWNYLVGYSNPEIDAKIVHYTLGTPDMVGDTEYDDEWWDYLENPEWL